jgi:hypothetical protein
MSETHSNISEETKQQISKSLKKIWQDPEYYETHIKHLKNPSDETRKKMSEAKKGVKPWNVGKQHSPESIQKMRQAKLGKKPSTETKKKQSKALKVYLSDPENKKKRSESMLGHYISDECKSKIGIANGSKIHYTITHPDGHEELVTYLNGWCRERNINPAGMKAAAKNGNITQKGYKITNQTK